MSVASDWYDDPTYRFKLRYYDENGVIGQKVLL